MQLAKRICVVCSAIYTEVGYAPFCSAACRDERLSLEQMPFAPGRNATPRWLGSTLGRLLEGEAVAEDEADRLFGWLEGPADQSRKA